MSRCCGARALRGGIGAAASIPALPRNNEGWARGRPEPMHHYVSALPYKARCSPAALPAALRCGRCPAARTPLGSSDSTGQLGSTLGNSAPFEQLRSGLSSWDPFGQLGSLWAPQFSAPSGQLGPGQLGSLRAAQLPGNASALGSLARPWQLGIGCWLWLSPALCEPLRLSSSSGPRRMRGRFGLGQFLSRADNKVVRGCY